MDAMNFENQDKAVIRQWMLDAQQREVALEDDVTALNLRVHELEKQLAKAKKTEQSASKDLDRLRKSRSYKYGKAISDTRSVKSFFTLPVRLFRTARSS